jgi:pimeloyl-ACP methyl ester carboxylesterase
MQNTFIKGLVLLAALAAHSGFAREVTLQHRGLMLNADFDPATGKAGADRVILLTHGALAHRQTETIGYLQRLFKERGYGTLAINLSLGLDNRHGMYDCKTPHRHRNQDAAEEIGAWVAWLRGQGAQRVALLGHSRGGAQTALFAAEQESALVHAAILMAPATIANNDAAEYQKRFNQALAPGLAQARQLLAAGQGDALLEHVNILTCADVTATAASFVSYYGEPARLDTPSLLPKSKKPVLVLVAGADEVVLGLDKKVAPLVDGKRVQMKVIDGSDHFFRDLSADDAVDAADAFLKSLGF